jgi:hypothetical protein
MTYPPGEQPGPQGQPYQPQGQPYQPQGQPNQPQGQPYQQQYPPPGQQAYQPYPQGYGAPAAPPPRRRGRTPLIIALIFGVVGLALLVVGGVVGFSQGLNKVNSFQRVSVADGIRTIHLTAGDYVAYYEAPNYNTNSNSVPILILRILDPQTGHFLTGSLYGGRNDHKVKMLTYDYNGHHGAALYQFRVPHTGDYKVQVSRSPSSTAPANADLAIGHSIATGLAIGVVLAMVGGLLILVAIILLIVGLVKRSRSGKEVAAAQSYGGPPPAYGGPPPGSGGWQPPQQ